MWCVISKQQGMCCLAPNINVILWTILICWLAVGTIITIIGCLGLIGLAPYFVVMIIVYAIDLLVLVPLTVWSIQAAVATCKGGATASPRARCAVVATPVGVSEREVSAPSRTRRRLAAGRVRHAPSRRSFLPFQVIFTSRLRKRGARHFSAG